MSIPTSILLSLLLLLLCGFNSTFALSLSPELLSRRLPGIWKLRTNSLPLDQPDIRSQLQDLLREGNNHNNRNDNDIILLKLNADGTFKQCNEGHIEGKWISGHWKVVEDFQSSSSSSTAKSTTTSTKRKLVLAMNRQYYGPQFDLVLEGCLPTATEGDKGNGEEEGNSLSLEGNVQKGKYLHPRGHTSFFEPPFLANPESIGPFHMEQSLSAYSVLGERLDTDFEDNDNEAPSQVSKIQNADFYGKTFIMTIEPLPQSKTAQEQTRNQSVDIRTMPVTFFANNTFAVIGMNKILRGRFQVQPTDSNAGNNDSFGELSLQVSLFGAGRSAPGSVYSEGMGLSHDDERTYIGAIQRVEQSQSKTHDYYLFYVQGTAFFGTDLGDDARPEPVAKFYLSQETTTTTRQTAAAVLTEDVYVTSQDDDDDTAYRATGGVFE